jgi:hemerythrin-like domain-containing protein
LKRSEQLNPLSHDHYNGLLVARRLQAGIDRGADPAVMSDYAVHFWDVELERHFRQEEEVLLEALKRIDPEQAGRMVDEHRQIAQLIRGLRDCRAECAELLDELVRLLPEHIRFEERKAFPTLEKECPPEELDAMGQQLKSDHPEADLGWEEAFWE